MRVRKVSPLVCHFSCFDVGWRFREPRRSPMNLRQSQSRGPLRRWSFPRRRVVR